MKFTAQCFIEEKFVKAPSLVMPQTLKPAVCVTDKADFINSAWVTALILF